MGRAFLAVAAWSVTGLMAAWNLSAAELGSFATPLYSGAGNCAFCHDPWDAGRAGQPGQAAVLASDWRATMMAQAFKDPLWRAVMEAEVKERPGLKAFIENKCQTCHAPLARSQALRQRNERVCLCTAARELAACSRRRGLHVVPIRFKPGNLGTPASFTGHFQIGTEPPDLRPLPGCPHHAHATACELHAPMLGAQTQDSALCATCHTVVHASY